MPSVHHRVGAVGGTGHFDSSCRDPCTLRRDIKPEISGDCFVRLEVAEDDNSFGPKVPTCVSDALGRIVLLADRQYDLSVDQPPSDMSEERVDAMLAARFRYQNMLTHMIG